MRNEMKQDELRPDPIIGAALRWAEGEVPLDDVDWSAMLTTIRNRAAMPLARRRSARRRVPRWVRPLIPIAAAASVAMVVWTGGIGRAGPTPAAQQAAAVASQITIQEALLTDLSEQEFRVLVSARTDPDELLMIAATAPHGSCSARRALRLPMRSEEHTSELQSH